MKTVRSIRSPNQRRGSNCTRQEQMVSSGVARGSRGRYFLGDGKFLI